MALSLSQMSHEQYLKWVEWFKAVSPIAAALDEDRAQPKYDAETANNADSDDPPPDDQDYGEDDSGDDDDPETEKERAKYREILSAPAY